MTSWAGRTSLSCSSTKMRRQQLRMRSQTITPQSWARLTTSCSLRCCANIAAFDQELLEATAYTQEQLEAAILDDEQTEVLTDAVVWGPYDLDTVVATAFEHYRAVGVPYRSLSVSECMQEINALSSLDAVRLEHSVLGYGVADTYHPHRFAAKIAGKATLLDVFASDVKLEQEVRLICAQSKPITDASLMNTLGFVRGAEAASNFRPGYACEHAATLRFRRRSRARHFDGVRRASRRIPRVDVLSICRHRPEHADARSECAHESRSARC